MHKSLLFQFDVSRLLFSYDSIMSKGEQLSISCFNIYAKEDNRVNGVSNLVSFSPGIGQFVTSLFHNWSESQFINIVKITAARITTAR